MNFLLWLIDFTTCTSPPSYSLQLMHILLFSRHCDSVVFSLFKAQSHHQPFFYSFWQPASNDKSGGTMHPLFIFTFFAAILVAHTPPAHFTQHILSLLCEGRVSQVLFCMGLAAPVPSLWPQKFTPLHSGPLVSKHFKLLVLIFIDPSWFLNTGLRPPTKGESSLVFDFLKNRDAFENLSL